MERQNLCGNLEQQPFIASQSGSNLEIIPLFGDWLELLKRVRMGSFSLGCR
jgi:hypothetical protein